MSVLKYSPRSLGFHPGRNSFSRPGLTCAYWLPAEWRVSLSDLQINFGPRRALQIVLRTRQALRRALAVQRAHAAAQSWLYDINFYLNLSYALSRETRLARLFLAHYRALRDDAKKAISVRSRLPLVQTYEVRV